MWKKFLKFSIDFIGIFFLILALYLVSHEIRELGFEKIINRITELPLGILGMALLFVACDYMAFPGYDFLALHYIGARLKKWLVIKTALVSFSVTNTRRILSLSILLHHNLLVLGPGSKGYF